MNTTLGTVNTELMVCLAENSDSFLKCWSGSKIVIAIIDFQCKFHFRPSSQKASVHSSPYNTGIEGFFFLFTGHCCCSVCFVFSGIDVLFLFNLLMFILLLFLLLVLVVMVAIFF